MATKKVKYVEPASYFSKETRKMLKIGEFAEPNTEKKKEPAKKAETKKK